MEKLVFAFYLNFLHFIETIFFSFQVSDIESPLPLENLLRSSTFDERITVYGSSLEITMLCTHF